MASTCHVSITGSQNKGCLPHLHASSKASNSDVSNGEPFNSIRTQMEMVRYYVKGLNVDDRKYTTERRMTECRKKEEKQNKIELFQEVVFRELKLFKKSHSIFISGLVTDDERVVKVKNWYLED